MQARQVADPVVTVDITIQLHNTVPCGNGCIKA
ncbi:hypothetical protein C8R32_101167 [Nitrosospira sp. Nsp5]|uniref:Uncharacterized protein n=1 Tax=Nitrosospira multiformis TaxID=1231 RepID=A0ABY0TIF5_9PROT|nr:hypothetical protein C8R32_101167 [Nitrosospira sp. Nsp5]SDQ79019.1 hypothetical protein SAMN05216402_2295 [Nitrosospira multiformis]